VQNELINIKRFSEDLDAINHQMQHFITESNLDVRSSFDHVSKEVSSTLTKRKLSGLIIDESGLVTKGDKSLGVRLPYCGNAGKITNSWVAMFACISNGDFAYMVNDKLYLDLDWHNDQVLCQNTGMSKENRTFNTKLKLTVYFIRKQVENVFSSDYMQGDSLYSDRANSYMSNTPYRYLLMLNIHFDQKIFTRNLDLSLPYRKSPKGPSPFKLNKTIPNMNVSEHMESIPSRNWKKIEVRNSAKGKFTIEYHNVQSFIWDKNLDLTEPGMLVIRKTISAKNKSEIKYSFTNAN